MKFSSKSLTQLWIWWNNHYDDVCCETAHKGRKTRVPHLHILNSTGPTETITLENWTQNSFTWVWAASQCYWFSQIDVHQNEIYALSEQSPVYRNQYYYTNVLLMKLMVTLVSHNKSRVTTVSLVSQVQPLHSLTQGLATVCMWSCPSRI